MAWYFANDGIGSKDIVVLSYKDRLSTFPKYLAYYEYIGKKYDSNVINKGITVYGNKDYIDQYSFIQQLLVGLKTFSSMLKSRDSTRFRLMIMIYLGII